MAKTMFVTVRVLVTGAGPKPIEALRFSGDTKGKLDSLLIALEKALAKLGLSCEGSLSLRKERVTLVVPSRQWNVAGVKPQVEEIIRSKFQGPLFGGFMM